ncbi:hypothetical protein ACU21_03770 [Actinobaculum suis]|nr:hypothetical protein ACU21_03770 [Actinobaculum suis]
MSEYEDVALRAMLRKKRRRRDTEPVSDSKIREEPLCRNWKETRKNLTEGVHRNRYTEKFELRAAWRISPISHTKTARGSIGFEEWLRGARGPAEIEIKPISS